MHRGFCPPTARSGAGVFGVELYGCSEECERQADCHGNHNREQDAPQDENPERDPGTFDQGWHGT